MAETTPERSPSELHLYRAVEGESPGRIKAEPTTAAALSSDAPTIVSMSGIMVSHDVDVAPIMAGDMKMAGIQPGSRGNLASIALTYPSAYLNTAMFNATMQNTHGPAGNPYSLYSMQLSTAVLGDVKDYGSLSPEAQRAEVQRLQKTIGSKVFVGMSMGTVMADGLQNAMVQQLTDHGFPADVIRGEIMPQLKIVNYAAIGPQQRGAAYQATGATIVSVVNNKDTLLNDMGSYGLHQSPDHGQGRGTAITRVGEREALVTVTLPDEGVAPKRSDPSQTSYTGNRDGHRPEAFVNRVQPSHHSITPGLSYTEVTGDIVNNTLHNLLEHARTVAATPAGADVPPPPAIIDAVVSSADPVYTSVMRAHVAHNGEPQSMSHAISGRASLSTPFCEQLSNNFKQIQFIDIGNKHLAVDMSGMDHLQQTQLLETLRVTGVSIKHQANDAISIQTQKLPYGLLKHMNISKEVPAHLDSSALKGWIAGKSLVMHRFSNAAGDGLLLLQTPEGTPHTVGQPYPPGTMVEIRAVPGGNFNEMLHSLHHDHPELGKHLHFGSKPGDYSVPTIQVSLEKALEAGILGDNPDQILDTLPRRQGEHGAVIGVDGTVLEPKYVPPPPKNIVSYSFRNVAEANEFVDKIVTEYDAIKKTNTNRYAEIGLNYLPDGRAEVRMLEGRFGVIPDDYAQDYSAPRKISTIDGASIAVDAPEGVKTPQPQSVSYNVAMNTAILAQSLVELSTNKEMSTGQKAVVGTMGAMGAGGIAADLGGFARTSSALGAAGGVFGVGTSTYSIVESYKQGSGTGVVLGTANLASSSAFTVAGVASMLGASAVAETATGVGVIIAIPTVIVATGLNIYSNGQQKAEYERMTADSDEQRKYDSQARISGIYRDVGLPSKPKLEEYNSLSRLNVETNGRLKKAFNEGDIDRVGRIVSASANPEEYKKWESIRNSANENMTSFLGSTSPIMKFLASEAEEMDMHSLERAEQGMLESLLGQGATREFNGTFDTPQGQKAPRGFKERFDEYNHLQQKGQQYDQQHNQPNGNGYQDQLTQLDKMPDIYRKLWHAKSVAGMEKSMGMVGQKEDELLVARAQGALDALKKKYDGTGYYVTVSHQRQGQIKEFHTYTQAEKDNINEQLAQAEAKLAEAQKQFAERNPEVAKERAFFEQAVAPGYDQTRDELEKAKAQQDKLEAHLSQGGNFVTPKGPRATPVLVPFTEAQKEELTAKIEAGREKLSELEAVFHEKHERATSYMISRLASKEAAAEYTRVNNMNPEEREAYFNKNRQFIADAKLEKRGDLAWVGISTSQQEMLARAIQFAPEAVASQAAEETKRNTEALAKSTQNSQSLRQQVAAFEAAGMQIPDTPILGPDGQPLKDATGNVVSMEQMQAGMLQKLQKDTQELEQLRETAAKFGTKELQAQVQIKEAAVSAEQLQLATLHEQNLAFKVAAVKSKTEQSQDTQVTTNVAAPQPQQSVDDSKAPKHLQAALAQYRSGYTPKDIVATQGPGTVPIAPGRYTNQQMA